MKKTNTQLLQQFITDEQILEVMIMYQDRKIAACNLLRQHLSSKWQVTVLEALGILQHIQKEL